MIAGHWFPFISFHSLFLSFIFLSSPYPISISIPLHILRQPCILLRLTHPISPRAPHSIALAILFWDTLLELEESQPKERERATEVTVGSCSELHKTNTLVIWTLQFVGARFCCNTSNIGQYQIIQLIHRGIDLSFCQAVPTLSS
jgi:hypothetical protein